MDALSSPATQIDAGALQASPTATAADLAKRGHAVDTAQNFETSFLSSMLQTMFEGVDAEPPFGGGQGEQMWKSFMAGAMAKQIVKAGGVGVSRSVAHELLKMQGLDHSQPLPLQPGLRRAA